MSDARFTDNLAPKLVAEAATYSASPAGPIQRATLTDSAGQLLGWVWVDGEQAAGWTPGESTTRTARAGAYVWRVLALAHQRGEPSSAVLDPALYAPLYQLGEPTES